MMKFFVGLLVGIFLCLNSAYVQRKAMQIQAQILLDYNSNSTEYGTENKHVKEFIDNAIQQRRSQ